MHISTKMKYVVLEAVYLVFGGTNFNQTQFVENIHIVDWTIKLSNHSPLQCNYMCLVFVLKICQFVFHDTKYEKKNTEHFILIESVNTL